MKITIEKSFANDLVSIFVVEDSHNERKIVTIGKNGKEFMLNAHERGTKMDPFLEIPTHLFDDLAKAILVYTEENNIKSERQTFFEGELIATKKHLEDSRKIITKLFNKK